MNDQSQPPSPRRRNPAPRRGPLCALFSGAERKPRSRSLASRRITPPAAILTKPGKLTDAEFEIVKTHPTVGFRRLCKRTDLSFAQLMMVYQHHERLDGSGYPLGICGSEMHPWARICWNSPRCTAG